MEKKQRTYFIGVRGKLVLPLLLLVVLSMWLLGLGLMKMTESAVRAQLAARVKVMASAMESAVKAERSLQARGPTDDRRAWSILESLLESITEDPEVERVDILDGSGRVILSSAPFSDPGRAMKGGGQTLGIAVPLSLGLENSESLNVLFSRQGLERQIALSHLRTIIQLAITALVLIIFINILVSLTVLAPIRKLLRATERIGSGDLGHSVEEDGGSEFGDLARSFNTMLKRLRESEGKIHRQLDSLRQAHSDLQAKEKQLIQTEKMATVGRLAAGVAHEVGNPLGSVTGYLAMLRDEKLSPEEWREYLDRTEQELARINRIMLDLLNYARPPQLELTSVDLNALLRDVNHILSSQPEFRAVSFRMELEDGLPPVWADLHRIQQMLVNITLNAAQSMPDSGTVVLQSLRLDRPGGGVGVRVRDHGPGISPEDLPHLFEPFFTSRKQGKGSGLGLALCQQIAQSLGASIEVDSKSGEGTIFTVCFPSPGSVPKEPRQDG